MCRSTQRNNFVYNDINMTSLSEDINLKNPMDKNRPVHIIGGGGVGMSALASLLVKSGYSVSASDKNGGKYLEKLGEIGAKVWTGSHPELIPHNALIFYSSAIGPQDPERLYAASQNWETHSRHGLLQAITREYHTIAISGTHGKTTTTGWIAYLLELAGLDPNALVGGTLVQWNSHIRFGEGQLNGRKILVMEADESDESFLHIVSQETVVTNIELDHVDRYADLNQVAENFRKFIGNCQKSGGVFFPSFEVIDLLKGPMNSFDKINEIIRNIRIEESAHGLDFQSKGQSFFFKVGLSGVHNLWNAFAVLVFALYHELPEPVIRDALLNFKGVERRMQKLGEFTNQNGISITVIDDYAHHPTEIKMVLETLLGEYENLVVVWEPHRISRMIHFNREFESVFNDSLGVEKIFLMPVFDAAGEKHMPEFSRFHETWNLWNSRVSGILETRGDYQKLIFHINTFKKKTALVFLGAGFSSEFALDFYKTATEKNIPVS